MTLLPSRREPFLGVLRWLPGGPAASAPEPWRAGGREPPLDDMLADPIVRAMMACDGVSEREVRAVIEGAGNFGSGSPQPRREGLGAR